MFSLWMRLRARRDARREALRRVELRAYDNVLAPLPTPPGSAPHRASCLGCVFALLVLAAAAAAFWLALGLSGLSG